MVLSDFDLSPKAGEKTGAGLQGVAFGFLYADNPHLQLEIGKVRTGSKRVSRAGDIDGWDGDRLAMLAEVKQFTIEEDAVPRRTGFANEVGRRGEVGIVFALGFSEEAEEAIEGLGLKPLTLEDAAYIVDFWDPIKEKIAVSSFLYYAGHVEQNSSLTRRLQEFLAAASTPPSPTPPE